MSEQVTIAHRPKCDFCDEPAMYDGKLAGFSSWAYMCKYHWHDRGVGILGTGYGQRLIVENE